MRILGIDPGSRRTGLGIIELDGSRLRHIHHCVLQVGDGDFSLRLLELYRGVRDLIAEFGPIEAAMEDQFVAQNAGTALKLGQARGALVVACAEAGLGVTPYPPATVKQAVCGYGRADKQQMQQMIALLLKPPGKLPVDAADALGIALCHAHHLPLRRIAQAARAAA